MSVNVGAVTGKNDFQKNIFATFAADTHKPTNSSKKRKAQNTAQLCK